MGGISYSTQSQLDFNKNGISKQQSKNNLQKFPSKQGVTYKNEIRQLDYRTMIFRTLFPKSIIVPNPSIISSNCNKSFDYLPNFFNRDNDDNNILHNCNSPQSVLDDNDSVKSDLIDIEECPLILNMTIKKQETYVKKGKKLRTDYYAKLVNFQVWQPTNKIKIHNTLFFYDWDDTLMCTSFITPNGQYSDGIKMSDKDIEKIKVLDSLVALIMQRSTSLGDVYIVTNAAPGWVEYSSKKFYPETSKALIKVKIISARGLFERKFPGDMKQWKIMAFNEILKSIDTRLVTNLICLGDSIMEIEAAHIFASNFNHAYIKTVKFKENPMPIDLNKQLSLVVNQLDKIYSCVKNLAIRVEKKKND